MGKKRIQMTEASRVKNQPYDVDVIPGPTHPTRATRISNRIAMVALVLVAMALSVLLMWAVEDGDILAINNNPFPSRVVPDPTGRTGGIVFLTVDYCKKSNATGTIRMSYVNKSYEVFLPIAKEQIQKGCEKREMPVVVPRGLLEGQYKIKFHVAYDINPLKQSAVTDFESQPFDIWEIKSK
jgi:hypothetical protein